MLAIFAALLFVPALFAAPSVTEVTARQRYPWNGMVDISCTAGGVVAGKNRTTVTATDLAAGTNVTVATLSVAGAAVENGAFSLAAGANQILWDAQKDLPKDYLSERMKIDVAVVPYSFSVKFNANGGTGTMANESFDYGTAKALTANVFTKSGYTFSGWATSASGAVAYTDKQSVSNLSATDKATVNLYAVWKGEFPVTNGLVVHWKFDGNGNDSGGNSFDLSGSSVSYKADRRGIENSAAYFNGSASLALNKSVGVKNSFTLSAWVKPEKTWVFSDETDCEMVSYSTTNYVWDDFPMIIIPSKGVKNTNVVGYHLVDGELGFAVGRDRIGIFAMTSIGNRYGAMQCFYYKKGLSLGAAWHHVVVTVDNRGAPKVYVDGSVLNGTASAFNTKINVSSTTVPSYREAVESVYIASSLDFGGRATNSYLNYVSPGNQAYKGYIDDFLIYNRALSATEVKSLYEASK